MRLVLEGYRCLYSPRIREGFFSETGLPTNPILGNWGFRILSILWSRHIRSGEGRIRTSDADFGA